MEVYVSLEGNEFVEVLDTPSTPEVVARLRGLPGLLSEGHEGEVNLGIAPWMQEVANALQRGFVVTIDYGHEAADLYAAARSRGSTHAYYRHTTPGNLYRRIGRQDITAHVDFTAVARAGEARGLRRVGLLSQAEFLGRLGLGEMLKGLRAMGLARAEYAANRMAMLELVDAEGLGGFKVMVQERGTGITDLEQVVTPGRAGRELAAEGSRVPLAGRDHLPLSRGRYPHTAWEAAHPWTA